MEIDLTSIEMSRKDVKKRLQLPVQLTESLAEDIGIMVGDGHVAAHTHKGCTNYEICVSGDAITDYNYLTDYVSKLKKNLYNLEFSKFFAGKRRSEFRLQTYSKGLVGFYSRIGLPLGKKINIRVPEIIKQSNEKIKRAFLRGFGDTDGGLILRKKYKAFAYYPSIKLASSSKPLIEDICEILIEIGFSYTVSFDLRNIHSKTGKISILHEISLNGMEKVEKWMAEIGTSNLATFQKFESARSMKRAHRDLNSSDISQPI